MPAALVTHCLQQDPDLLMQDHINQLAAGVLTMLDQVAAEHEALSGMREKTISIGQPVNVGAPMH